jgi:hypothetical protein
MAKNLRDEIINGYTVAVCENTQDKTFYLYEADVIIKGQTKTSHIWAWDSTLPTGSNIFWDVKYTPCVMPSGYELTEAVENNQPILRKR